MYIHHDKGLIFLAQPRCASHAIADALVDQAGFEMLQGHHAMMEHLSVDEEFKLRECGEDSLGRKVYFSTLQHQVAIVVRDHLTALQSWQRLRWKDWAMPLSTRFILKLSRDEEFCAPHRLFPLTDQATVVLRYEDLPGSLNRWLAAAGLTEIALGRINVSAPNAYDQMTEALETFIEIYYYEERVALGYQKQPNTLELTKQQL